MTLNSVTITSGEYYELVAADVKLDLITAMLHERLDKVGYARIDDICEILGIKYFEEGKKDE